MQQPSTRLTILEDKLRNDNESRTEDDLKNEDVLKKKTTSKMKMTSKMKTTSKMKMTSKMKTAPQMDICTIVGGIVYYLKKLLMTPHLDSHSTSDLTLEMLSFV